MRIYPPRGDLKFWSVLWILSGVLSIYLGVAHGQTAYLFIGPIVGVCAAGLWFQSRACGYLLAIIISLGIILAVGLLITKEFRWLKVARILLSCYFVFILYRWIGEREQEEMDR